LAGILSRRIKLVEDLIDVVRDSTGAAVRVAGNEPPHRATRLALHLLSHAILPIDLFLSCPFLQLLLLLPLKILLQEELLLLSLLEELGPHLDDLAAGQQLVGAELSTAPRHTPHLHVVVKV